MKRLSALTVLGLFVFSAVARSEEPPPRMCDGFAGIRCGDGEVCEHPVNKCHVADGSGFCQPQPKFCTREYRPVCGCNGKTYENDCELRAAGEGKLRDGAC